MEEHSESGIEAAGFSDAGARPHNEDAILLCDQLGMFAVADGVGGMQGGEVASALVCKTLEESVRNGDTLASAVDKCHLEILNAVSRGEGNPGMASTAVAAKVQGADLELAWVGDSRAYLWDGDLHLLTKDHSFVQGLVDVAQLDFAQMDAHPERNLLTQALGSRNIDPVTDTRQGGVKTPCILLLCSDGISSVLPESELIETLSLVTDVQACARQLVESAVNSGGQDNASCIVVRLPKSRANQPELPPLEAFMRYDTADNRWHLAEADDLEQTQSNPPVEGLDELLSGSTPNRRMTLGRSVLGLAVLLGAVYAIEVSIGWASLLSQASKWLQ